MVANRDHWRIFIAIPIPQSVKKSLFAWAEMHKERMEFSKWVHPEDYHITVQFLGDTPSSRIPEIRANLEQAMANRKALTLTAGPCGIFGRPLSPRVLWASVSGDLKELHILQSRVIEANRAAGILPEERPYHPHITLARKYRLGYPFDAQLLKRESPDYGSWIVDAVVIYRTHMNKRPMYEEVERIPLLT